MLNHVKAYILKNRDALTREGRFVLILSLWVGFFVAVNRGNWKSATEVNQLKEFSSGNQQTAEAFEKRLSYWERQAQKISQLSLQVSPSIFKQQLSIWKASLEGQPDWLATHVVTQRKGFEPSVVGSVYSASVDALLAADVDSPVPWQKEIQSNSLQIVASLKNKKSRNLSMVRSLKANAHWIQTVFKSSSTKKDWSIWIVHTLSEQLVPTLLDKTNGSEAALYDKENDRFLFSDAFKTLKIDAGELRSFIRARNQNSGSTLYQFATDRKSSWVAWSSVQKRNSVLISVLPNKKIPTPLLPESPAATHDFLVTLTWLLISYTMLSWTHKKGFWQLRIKKLEGAVKEQAVTTEEPQSQLGSRLSNRAREHEFCSHLLSDFGPSGDIKLSGPGSARVQVIAAERYKGSWWTLKAIDNQRAFIAVGDTTGEGIAAGAASYAMKYILEKALTDAQNHEDSEELLKQLFNLCALSAESALLSSSHVALFMAIISVDSHNMTFINAGYPAPMLTQNAKKKVLLNSDSDPLGLGGQTTPLPRWVNLTQGCRLSICNVGVRNNDLPELDDSELIKISVSPFGEVAASEFLIDEENAA